MVSRGVSVNEVPVTEALLDGDLLGYYDRDRGLIVVDRRLLDVEKRCTITHERIHAERQDEAITGTADDVWFGCRQERTVSVEAARRLIPLAAMVDALRWTNDDHELAEILDVDLDTLHCRSSNFTAQEVATIERQLWDDWRSA